MIASGLMLMGGCFAQDDDGAAVDFYWPAAHVDIPQKKGVNIISIPFPGGDSEHDVIRGGGYFDWSVPDSPMYQYSLGLGSFSAPDGAYIGGGGLRNNMNTGQVRFHDAMANIDASYKGWFHLYIGDGRASAILDDKEWTSEYSSFSLPMTANRPFRLRYWHLLSFSYFYYSNAGTGVKWQVMPMRSACGNIAVWESWLTTLTEL